MQLLMWCRQRRQLFVVASAFSRTRKAWKAKHSRDENLTTCQRRSRQTPWEMHDCLHAWNRRTRARSSRTYRLTAKFQPWSVYVADIVRAVFRKTLFLFVWNSVENARYIWCCSIRIFAVYQIYPDRKLRGQIGCLEIIHLEMMSESSEVLEMRGNEFQFVGLESEKHESQMTQDIMLCYAVVTCEV